MSAAEAAPSDDLALARAAARLGEALRARGLRIGLAESCTGGWIAKLLTDIPGSSDWFERGYVTYSNRAKTADLGVAEALLATEGAVSEAAVRAMVQGLRRATGCQAAIAVSGIAGPGGGSRDKPVGTVHFAFALGDRDWVAMRRFGGDRDAVRRHSVAFTLEQMNAALASEARA
jgi:nicotinamide-nucleotide amidase